MRTYVVGTTHHRPEPEGAEWRPIGPHFRNLIWPAELGTPPPRLLSTLLGTCYCGFVSSFLVSQVILSNTT